MISLLRKCKCVKNEKSSLFYGDLKFLLFVGRIKPAPVYQVFKYAVGMSQCFLHGIEIIPVVFGVENGFLMHLHFPGI
jgi:hypothetical protein